MKLSYKNRSSNMIAFVIVRFMIIFTCYCYVNENITSSSSSDGSWKTMSFSLPGSYTVPTNNHNELIMKNNAYVRKPSLFVQNKRERSKSKHNHSSLLLLLKMNNNHDDYNDNNDYSNFQTKDSYQNNNIGINDNNLDDQSQCIIDIIRHVIDKNIKSITKQYSIPIFAIIYSIMISLLLLQPHPSIAYEVRNDEPSTTNTIKNNRSRYWSLINSNNKEEIISANEKLMDYAVGTINTMYYDNSGGAFFYPKDFYDRWKVLRVYAKEGIDGVQDMISHSNNVKQVSKVNKVIPKASAATVTATETEQFNPQLFIIQDNQVKVKMNYWNNNNMNNQLSTLPPHAFDSREDVVTSLKWLVGTLDDPYSKYLTREELQQELNVRNDGFLGLGFIVEAPSDAGAIGLKMNGLKSNSVSSSLSPTIKKSSKKKQSNDNILLSSMGISNLPVVTAVAPNSPAEKSGIVVGDRIAAVGSDEFLGLKVENVMKKFRIYTGAENYFGNPELTVAKPVYRDRSLNFDDSNSAGSFENVDISSINKDEVIGYKLSRVRLATISLQSGIVSDDTRRSPMVPTSTSSTSSTIFNKTPLSGGDSIVQWELLTPNESIFRKSSFLVNDEDNISSFNNEFRSTDRVGYIRLTRFSRLSTAGFVNAIEELEKAGAQSYIIDVRNNYGGVIQESMLIASSLLRDPHTVLCYTLNSRGGFTPHDAEEYIVDTRYPGYLLSSESRDVTMEQVKRDSPNFVNGEGWIPPSAYASIREQRMNRGISRTSFNVFGENFKQTQTSIEELKQLRAQKKVIILMNEGTGKYLKFHDNDFKIQS